MRKPEDTGFDWYEDMVSHIDQSESPVMKKSEDQKVPYLGSPYQYMREREEQKVYDQREDLYAARRISAEDAARTARDVRNTNSSTHRCWETGMKGAPKGILDSNGEVVLALCMNCGRGEIQLEQEPCDHRTAKVAVMLTKNEVEALSKIVGSTVKLLTNTFKDSSVPFDLGPLKPLQEKMLNVAIQFPDLARTGKPYEDKN